MINNNNHVTPVIFGEVLFDCFPDGNTVMGGAPFNVAWHLQAFGLSPLMISSIGDDALGTNVMSAMQDWSMSTAGIQLDPEHPTGSVDIVFNNGEPHYTIVEHRAYDFISADSLPPLPENRLLYHGSLSLRNQDSLDALLRLKAHHMSVIFMDVNLRDPWWQKESILNYSAEADWVKLNEEELIQLGSGAGNVESRAKEFLHTHKLKGLVVTLGDKGAFALTDVGDIAKVTPSETLEIIDTVGAGDAFTSVLILGLSLGWQLELAMQRAQYFASQIVGQQGATVHNRGFYQSMITDWCL